MLRGGYSNGSVGSHAWVLWAEIQTTTHQCIHMVWNLEFRTYEPMLILGIRNFYWSCPRSCSRTLSKMIGGRVEAEFELTINGWSSLPLHRINPHLTQSAAPPRSCGMWAPFLRYRRRREKKARRGDPCSRRPTRCVKKSSQHSGSTFLTSLFCRRRWPLNARRNQPRWQRQPNAKGAPTTMTVANESTTTTPNDSEDSLTDQSTERRGGEPGRREGSTQGQRVERHVSEGASMPSCRTTWRRTDPNAFVSFGGRGRRETPRLLVVSNDTKAKGSQRRRVERHEGGQTPMPSCRTTNNKAG